MPLTRERKAEVIDEITQMLDSTTSVYLTDYSGLSVAQANELRNRFRDAGVDFKVLKNTLIRLAMERVGGYDDVLEYLEGPTAVALSENPAAPARVMKTFVRDEGTDRPELKAAFVDGAVYGAGTLDVLAALKSREELIGDVVGLIMAPISNIIGGLNAQGETLAGALKAIAEKEES